LAPSTTWPQVPQNLDGPEELGNCPAAWRELIRWSFRGDVAAGEEGRQSLLHYIAAREAIIQFRFRQRAPAMTQPYHVLHGEGSEHGVERGNIQREQTCAGQGRHHGGENDRLHAVMPRGQQYRGDDSSQEAGCVANQQAASVLEPSTQTAHMGEKKD